MTSISTNVYIDKLDDIVNTYIIHNIAQLKWNLLMQNETYILTLVRKLLIKISNLKLVILLDYQDIKMLLEGLMYQIGLKMFLWLKNLKILCRGDILIVTLKAK